MVRPRKWRTAIIFFWVLALLFIHSIGWCRLTWLAVDSQINSSKLFSGTIMAHHFHGKAKKEKLFRSLTLRRCLEWEGRDGERTRVRDRRSWRGDEGKKLFSTYIFQFTAAAVSCWFRFRLNERGREAGSREVEWICTRRRATTTMNSKKR